MENPSGPDAEEFDRRWADLAEQLQAEMSAPSANGPTAAAIPPAGDSAPDDPGTSDTPDLGSDAAGPSAPNPNGDQPGGFPEGPSASARQALEALADGRDPWIESAEDTGVADGEWGEIVSRADGPRDWTAPEDEEHFDPPEPPPVTAGEPLLVLAWVFTFVGLLGLALVVVLHLTVPWFVPRALGLLAAAGIAALIWRMPHKRTDPDDNGAQV